MVVAVPGVHNQPSSQLSLVRKLPAVTVRTWLQQESIVPLKSFCALRAVSTASACCTQSCDNHLLDNLQTHKRNLVHQQLK